MGYREMAKYGPLVAGCAKAVSQRMGFGLLDRDSKR